MSDLSKDKYIIVNYHYVEDPRPKSAGISPCSIAEFDRQISYLSKNFKIVNLGEIYQAAVSGKEGKFCAITFDDGLKDNYVNAFPILQKYQATATFFIITSVFEHRLPAAHKIHILLSRFTADQIIDLFHTFIGEFYPDLKNQYIIPKDRRLTERRMHEGVAMANFKETMIALPEDVRSQFLRYGFKINKLNEEKISSHLFLNREEIKALLDGGMQIGSHSHGHYSMSGDDESFLRKDVKLSKEILSGIIGAYPKWFSYPHGRSSAVAERVLREEGFDLAVTIQRKKIESTDSPLTIPRYDTIDIKEYLDEQKI
ncbi:MAG: polysaccharide deacetylase family protein [bacterium]|nr:polysaccharide deacetylase family protein [bacterium]